MPIRTIVFAVFLWLLNIPASYSAPITAEEPQLRAAVIHGIIRFTTWPDTSNKTSLSLCTVGEPISEPPLRQIEKIVDREVIIKSSSDNDINLNNCDVIVFGSSIKKENYVSYIEQTKELPILTICDDCPIRKSGAIISLKYNRNRIGFTVDISAAKAHSIYLSSSLLELAMEVQP